MMKIKNIHPRLLKVVTALFVIGLLLTINSSFTVEYFLSSAVAWREAALTQTAYMFVVLFCFYVFIYALPTPLGTLLSVSAGYVFGFGVGLVFVIMATISAALITFACSRKLGRTWLNNRYGRHLARFHDEIEQAGFWYAIGLRLVPGIPFFILNAALALSVLGKRTFVISTMLGMLPVSAILVNAGNRLGELQELSDIFTLPMIFSLLLVAVFVLFVPFMKRRLNE